MGVVYEYVVGAVLRVKEEDIKTELDPLSDEVLNELERIIHDELADESIDLTVNAQGRKLMVDGNGKEKEQA